MIVARSAAGTGRIEGRATEAATIAPDGRVDDAALATVRRWRVARTGRVASVQRTLNCTLPGPG